MMIANGTQLATAHETPTQATIVIACQTLVMKNVEAISALKKTREPVQMFRRRNGMYGSLTARPSRAASARHSSTVFRRRAVSASSEAKSDSCASRRASRAASSGRSVPAMTATTEGQNQSSTHRELQVH
jgi:hypothetical protein